MTCKSAKLDKKPPFKITGATYNNWVGGQPGASGIRVIIAYDTNEDVTFDKIYFHKKEGKIDAYKKEGKVYLVGHINTSKPRGNDLVLEEDPKKEVNNKLPEETTFPYELKDDEAIISYTHKGKVKFYKVKNIKQTKTDFYP